MKRTKTVVEDIPSKAYFHALRHFNREAYKYFDEGCKLKISELNINGKIMLVIIP